MSQLNLIWANKPGCSKAVAEFWIGATDLWFTMFIDDADNTLKIEMLQMGLPSSAHFIHFNELERLLETAKLDLSALANSRAVAV